MALGFPSLRAARRRVAGVCAARALARRLLNEAPEDLMLKHRPRPRRARKLLIASTGLAALSFGACSGEHHVYGVVVQGDDGGDQHVYGVVPRGPDGGGGGGDLGHVYGVVPYGPDGGPIPIDVDGGPIPGDPDGGPFLDDGGDPHVYGVAPYGPVAARDHHVYGVSVHGAPDVEEK